jgi:hypothetical protein
VSARASSQWRYLAGCAWGNSVSEESKRAEVRRGRISHTAYVRVVGQALPRDWFALESCEILAQLDLVERLVARYPERYPSRGWAVRAFLDKAVDDVVTLCQSRSDLASMQLVRFLEARRNGASVAGNGPRQGLVARVCLTDHRTASGNNDH